MDGLGSLLTYPQLQNTLRIEFARARRYSYPLCCLALQVDGLDRIRDLHGSAQRDQALGHVVKMIQAKARASDSVALFHDRIAVVLPHTDAAGARAFAERVREQVRREAFRFGGKEIRFTVSIGLSTFAERTTIFYDSILKTTESALQAAASAGGDRIEAATPGPSQGSAPP